VPGNRRSAPGADRSAPGAHQSAPGGRPPASGPVLSRPELPAAPRSKRQPRGTRVETCPAAATLAAEPHTPRACARQNLSHGARLARRRTAGQLACQRPTGLVRRADATACRRPGQCGRRRWQAPRWLARHWPAHQRRAHHRAQRWQAGHSLAGRLPGAWSAPEPVRLRRGTGSSRNHHRPDRRTRTHRHRVTFPGRVVRVAAALGQPAAVRSDGRPRVRRMTDRQDPWLPAAVRSGARSRRTRMNDRRGHCQWRPVRQPGYLTGHHRHLSRATARPASSAAIPRS
jgi:hypothetical protein